MPIRPGWLETTVWPEGHALYAVGKYSAFRPDPCCVVSEAAVDQSAPVRSRFASQAAEYSPKLLRSPTNENEKPMTETTTYPATAVATFDSHADAETAVKNLGLAGFDIKHLSVVGKGYHIDEQVTGFYNQGDRIRLWGARGAFWGALWSLFFGGIFVTVPLVGPVVALGYLGLIAIGVLEGAALVGGVSAISAALYGIGIPKDSVLQYETAIKTDAYLVMVHDTSSRIAIARYVLETAGASRVDVHEGLCPKSTSDALEHAE